jgi:lipoate-protein ligase A
VRSALREFGIDSRLVVCGEEQKFGPVLCFRHHTPGDLTVQGNKVAGSAQRKHRGALLQHGSILLERSRFAPDLLGLRELGGQAVAGHQLVARLPALLAQKTGWQLQADDWTAEEREQHYPAALDKFAQREWIEKR